MIAIGIRCAIAAALLVAYPASNALAQGSPAQVSPKREAAIKKCGAHARKTFPGLLEEGRMRTRLA
jgi:hypothetical protein